MQTEESATKITPHKSNPIAVRNQVQAKKNLKSSYILLVANTAIQLVKLKLL